MKAIKGPNVENQFSSKSELVKTPDSGGPRSRPFSPCRRPSFRHSLLQRSGLNTRNLRTGTRNFEIQNDEDVDVCWSICTHMGAKIGEAAAEVTNFCRDSATAFAK